MSVEDHKYEGDNRPCVVARDRCGCYKAVHALDPSLLRSAAEFMDECKEWGATLEIRPLSFVRTGNLTFDCKHGQAELFGQGPVAANAKATES